MQDLNRVLTLTILTSQMSSWVTRRTFIYQLEVPSFLCYRKDGDDEDLGVRGSFDLLAAADIIIKTDQLSPTTCYCITDSNQ